MQGTAQGLDKGRGLASLPSPSVGSCLDPRCLNPRWVPSSDLLLLLCGDHLGNLDSWESQEA